jgi:hypothetical protein
MIGNGRLGRRRGKSRERFDHPVVSHNRIDVQHLATLNMPGWTRMICGQRMNAASRHSRLKLRGSQSILLVVQLLVELITLPRSTVIRRIEILFPVPMNKCS